MICKSLNKSNLNYKHECSLFKCDELKNEMIKSNLYFLKILLAAKFTDKLEDGLRTKYQTRNNILNNSIEEIKNAKIDTIEPKEIKIDILNNMTKIIEEKISEKVAIFEKKLQDYSNESKNIITEIKINSSNQTQTFTTKMNELQSTIVLQDKRQNIFENKLDNISDQTTSIYGALMGLVNGNNQRNTVDRTHHNSQPTLNTIRSHPYAHDFRNHSMNDVRISGARNNTTKSYANNNTIGNKQLYKCNPDSNSGFYVPENDWSDGNE